MEVKDSTRDGKLVLWPWEAGRSTGECLQEPRRPPPPRGVGWAGLGRAAVSFFAYWKAKVGRKLTRKTRRSRRKKKKKTG